MGIDTGFDGQLERCAVLAVGCVDGGAASDQLPYGLGPCPPRRNMQGGALLCDAVVTIPFPIKR